MKNSLETNDQQNLKNKEIGQSDKEISRSSRHFEIKDTTPQAKVNNIKQHIRDHFSWLEANYQQYHEIRGSSAEGFRKEYLQLVRNAQYYESCINNNLHKEAFSQFHQNCANDLEKRRNELEGILSSHAIKKIENADDRHKHLEAKLNKLIHHFPTEIHNKYHNPPFILLLPDHQLIITINYYL